MITLRLILTDLSLLIPMVAKGIAALRFQSASLLSMQLKQSAPIWCDRLRIQKQYQNGHLLEPLNCVCISLLVHPQTQILQVQTDIEHQSAWRNRREMFFLGIFSYRQDCCESIGRIIMFVLSLCI